jgi:DNA repair protein RecO (recombination protein O)
MATNQTNQTNQTYHKTRALILKRTKYGEADLIVHFLCADGAKLSALARGALKSKKRFGGGVLEPTHYVEIQYKTSSDGSRLATIEEASLIDGFEKLRSQYERLQTALKVVEVISHLGQEGDSQSENLYNLAGHSLRVLQVCTDLQIFKMHFFLKLLAQQGVLEKEDWMESFLVLPMAKHNELPADCKQRVGKLSSVEFQVDVYLKTAQVF